MGNLIDITGNDYNFLHVLGLSHIHNGESYWRCQCTRCGRSVVVRKNNFAYEWSRQKKLWLPPQRAIVRTNEENNRAKEKGT